MIITHHPLPFYARETLDHRGACRALLLLELIAARIGVYSPHTAFDSATDGINQRLAVGLGLVEIAPLVLRDEGHPGVGRQGRLPEPCTLGELAARLKAFLHVPRLQVVGCDAQPRHRVAVACGAADELLAAARAAACDAMLLGEARFHTCLEADAAGIGLVLPGHFASERFALERLAEIVGRQFPQVEIWASTRERDPLRWVE